MCSKPRGARGIEPETFRRRGQLLSRPPTTGPHVISLCALLPASCRGGGVDRRDESARGAHQVHNAPGMEACESDLLQEVCHKVVAVAAAEAVHAVVEHRVRVVQGRVPRLPDVVSRCQRSCSIRPQLHVPTGVAKRKAPSHHTAPSKIMDRALAGAHACTGSFAVAVQGWPLSSCVESSGELWRLGCYSECDTMQWMSCKR